MKAQDTLQDSNYSSIDARELIERLRLGNADIWRRAAAGGLVLFSGLLPFLMMAKLIEAFNWSILFTLLSLLFVTYLMLRSEAVALWRYITSRRIVKEHWNLFRFCLATSVLVFLVESISLASYGRFPVLASPSVVAVNVLLLGFLTGILFALTNQLAFSVAFIYTVYLFAFVANILKVQYLQTTIRPLDVYYLSALSEFSEFFCGTTVLTMAIGTGVLWVVLLAVLWFKGHYRIRFSTRVWLAAACIAGVFGMMYCDKNPTVAAVLKAIDKNKNWSNGIRFSERRGFLFEFLTDIPDSIIISPADYTPEEIARAKKEHYPSETPSASSAQDHVNVVVYLVESFMDPADLHINFTSDPTPFFHAAAREHTSGYIVVPCRFAGSTNTEFEVLTGMSCSSLPKGSCPYVQYIKQDIPSVPQFFQQLGYKTFAAHAGPPCLYDRVRVYEHLDVGETIWLTQRTKEKLGLDNDIKSVCPVDVDIAGRFPTDDSLVDAVIETSKANPRYFMYASANSTHSPYNYSGYLASDLDVLDPMSPSAKNELKTYINSIRTADRAIGKMLDYFKNVPEKTIVVIIGDHRPPMENSTEIYTPSGCLDETDPAVTPEARKIPVLIWTNYRKNDKDPDILCSTNFLPTEILSRIGIQPTGFLAVNNALRKQLSVFSNTCIQTKDGQPTAWDTASPALLHLMNDYRLLQFDMLLGEQYAAKNTEPMVTANK